MPTFQMTINPAPAPTFTPNATIDPGQETVPYQSGPQNGFVGTLFGGAQPYTISNVTGLPSGLTLALYSDGVSVRVTGTPAVGSAGNYNVSFNASSS